MSVPRFQPTAVMTAFLVLFTTACDREPGILLNIEEWPNRVERIRVRTTLEESVGTDIFFNRDQSRFAVRVPAGSRGTVQLEATGLDLRGCKLATGTLNEPIPDNLNRFVERTIVLSALSAPICVLAPSTPVPVGNQPDAVAVGDFNGDTLSDVAVANSGSDTVGILLGDAVRGVVLATTLSFPGSAPDAVALGDAKDKDKFCRHTPPKGCSDLTEMETAHAFAHRSQSSHSDSYFLSSRLG